jgi:hypothetical protein
LRGKERERAILMCVCVCSVDALLSRPECIEMKYENGVRKTDVDEGGAVVLENRWSRDQRTNNLLAVNQLQNQQQLGG